MIELKGVTTRHKADTTGLEDYSLIVNNGEFRVLDKMTGTLVIRTLLGFQPVAEGYVSIDGMLLSERSVAYMRKKMAYIPQPEGFDDIDDPARKQVDMVEAAVGSGADILLAVDPVSHQTAEAAANIVGALKRKAQQGWVVLVASDDIEE